MIGNFSFGEKSREVAITEAWDFLTGVLKLPKDRLHISVYETDQETYNIWRNKIGIPEEQLEYKGKEDNWWMMGDVGPCGPCTEIHWDKLEKGEDGERYVCMYELYGMFIFAFFT